jgi:acyl carrier protein
VDADEAFDLVKKNLVDHFEIPPEKVTPSANLFRDLDLDSIDALDMIALLESNLHVKVDEDELKKIRKVKDVVSYILRHLPE